MTVATAQDLIYRLQYLTKLIADETIALQKKIRLGSECCSDWTNLETLIMMYDALKEYDFDGTNNCLTITQVSEMFDYISKKYDFFFPPYESNYGNVQSIPTYNGVRITEDDATRLTEGDSTRIIE